MNNTTKANKSSQTANSKCRVIKIGLDIHARFIVATRQMDDGKPQPPQKFLVGDFLTWMQKQVTLAEKVFTCYEAGPTGFWLHRDLTILGVINYVICPTCLDSRKKGVNTDRTDANELESRLDRYLAGNQRVFSVVHVPTLEQE